MSETRLPVQPQSRVVIDRTGGELTLKGWNQDEIRIQAPPETQQIEELDGGFQLEFSGDGVLHIPHTAGVEINRVGGDARVKGLQGALKVQKVGGDLFLSELGETEVSSVGGDLFAKNIRGNLAVGKCGGDCTIQDTDGQLAVEKTGGDLIFKDIGGGISARAGGEVHGSFSPVSWQAYSLRSEGDLAVQLPADLNGEIDCRSKAGRITFLSEDHQETSSSKEVTKTFGEGGVRVHLEAKGEITVTTREESWSPKLNLNLEVDPDFPNFAEEITEGTIAQLEKQLSGLDRQLQESLSGITESLSSLGIPEDELRSIQEKIAFSGESAARSVEKITQKTQAKIEQRIAKAQSKARTAQKLKRDFDLESFLGESNAEKDLEEERMLILKMLQEKKITAEQADELLSALEERS